MTNGFNQVAVLAALENRMGWMMPTSSYFRFNGETLGVDGDSGRYYDDFHPIVNLRNLLDIQSDESITANDFSTYLSSINRANILKVLNACFDKQCKVESGYLVEQDDDVTPIYNSGSNFVGWKFEVADSYAVKALSAILTFDSAVTFNLYLYHSFTKTPLKTKSVTTLANEQKVVDLTDWVMDNYSYKGGYFYIGYFQDDIGSAQSVDRVEEVREFIAFDVEQISMEHIGTILNTTNQGISPATSYGLSLELASYRDYTQDIVNMPHLFDEALGYAMATRIIELFMFSMRTNRTESKMNNEELQRLYISLNSNEDSSANPYVDGVKGRYQKAIKNLKNAFFERKYNIVITPC